MTKKHFEALAAAIKANRPVLNKTSSNGIKLLEAGRLNQWDDDAHMVANVCSQFNPRFDRARFLKACGLGVTQ